jgi:hypothetical protein
MLGSMSTQSAPLTAPPAPRREQRRRSEPAPGAPVGVAIGAVVTLFLVTVPFVLVVLVYLFVTIYGFTKGTALHGSTINVGVVFAGIAVIVATLLVGMAATVSLIGKAISPDRGGKARGPRRRGRRGPRVGSEGGS